MILFWSMKQNIFENPAVAVSTICIDNNVLEMSYKMRNRIFLHVRQTKAQISQRICAV